MSSTVFLESSPIPSSTHTSLLSDKLSTGCLLSTTLYLRLPYWCTSSFKVVILTVLNLCLNLDILCRILMEVKLLVYLRFHTSNHQYKSTKHFVLSFAYDASEILNDLPDDIHPATSLSSFRNHLKNTSLEKHVHNSFCFSSFSPSLSLLCLCLYDDRSFIFCIVCLQSVKTEIKQNKST